MTVPGGYVAGDTLSAANMNLLPGGKMGYAEVTANQTGITDTAADLTSLTVTWTAVSARRYRTSFFVTLSAQTTIAQADNDLCRVQITDGSNNIKTIGTVTHPVVDVGMSCVASVTETGLSGSTTRKLRGRRGNGFGTGNAMSLLAASTYPAYILVEDIGPA